METKTTRKRPAQPEFDMQSALFAWARNRAVIAKHPELELLEGSMNGVKLTTAQAGKAKAAGMLKGAHDIRLPVARGGFIGLSIELKAGRNKLTPEQLAYGKRLTEEGWRVRYVWDEWLVVKHEIEAYLAMPKILPVAF